jgi:hypothetical protein
VWRGKGEATEESEGLKELKPRRLGEARPEKVSPRGRDCRLFASKLGRRKVLVLTARAPDFDVYQPSAVWICPENLLDGT